MTTIASRVRSLWNRRAPQWPLPLAAGLLLSLLLAAACGGGGGGGGGDAVKDVLQLLPGDTSGIVYVNSGAILDDDDLRGLRRGVQYNWDRQRFAANYGLYLNNLSYFIRAHMSDGDVFVFGGLDDLDDLRDELSIQGYDEEEIRDVEVWVRAGQSRAAFAFLPNGSVLVAVYESTVEDILRRREMGGPSLYDEVEDVVSLLSSEVWLSVSSGCHFTDCTAEGFSIEKQGSLDVGVLYVREFESERDANQASYHLVDDYAFDDDCDKPRVSRNGRLVEQESTCDMDAVSGVSGRLNF